MRRGKYKRKAFQPIDPDNFRELRLLHRYSIESTGKLLHVTARTVAHWESGCTRIPYAAYKLLRILAGYELPGPAWQGWCLRGDTLWSPSNRPFQPHQLVYLANYLTMARYWQSDYERRSKAAQQAAEQSSVSSMSAPLRLVK